MTKAGGKEFQGANIKECLSLASFSLGVPVENIKYTILEEKHGFFKKHTKILVDTIEDITDDEDINKIGILEKSVSGKDDHNENIIENQQEINGSIEIVQGKIIIKNPAEGGKPAVISPSNNITVLINGENMNKRTSVYADSKMEILFKNEEAQRFMNLKISADKMEAYVTINYKPNIIYKLKDALPTNNLIIEADVKEEIMPPKFTQSEVKDELLNHNIKYGILKMGIMKSVMADEISELLIASGKKALLAIDDKVEVKYEVESQKSQNVDNTQVIDYKAIGAVKGVEVGQVLAVFSQGKNGEDGIDITGKIIKVRASKKIVLGVGEGCQITDDFTVVATSKGKPSSRGYTFYVYKTHEINGDVELKTGNIKFVGDIVINGSVREGMKVEAGNSILIKNNVAEAEITASGDVVVKGNVIHSNVAAGKEDVLILEYLSDLNSMKNDLEKLTSSIRQLKEMNLIERNTSDGELVKTLLETKFKKLPQTAIRIAQRILKQGNTEDELVFIIKNRMLHLGPLNIRNYEELNDAVSIIDNKIELISTNLTLPVDVVLDYCQDSIIKSSGNIIFTGKGQYVSQIEASNSIIFQNDKSVARGGVIKAGREIRCKVVGGQGGVATKLIVENNGHIWAEVAYPNTRFIIGTREYILDSPSKEVHVFIDEDRELAVHKLQL